MEKALKWYMDRMYSGTGDTCNLMLETAMVQGKSGVKFVLL